MRGRPYTAPIKLPAQGIALGAVEVASGSDPKLWSSRGKPVPFLARFYLNLRATLRAQQAPRAIGKIYFSPSLYNHYLRILVLPPTNNNNAKEIAGLVGLGSSDSLANANGAKLENATRNFSSTTSTHNTNITRELEVAELRRVPQQSLSYLTWLRVTATLRSYLKRT